MNLLNKIKDFMKKHFIIVVIVGIILIGIIVAVILVVMNNSVEEEPTTQFLNTEELIKNVDKLTTKAVSGDKIEFSSDIQVSVGEKIAVWIYSEPKFLGYFIVQEVNGVKFIEGLKEALENLELSIGVHHLALSEGSGIYIGYIEVSISEDGYLQDVEVEQLPQEEEDNKQSEDEQSNAESNNGAPVEEEKAEDKPNTNVNKTTVKEETTEEEIAYSTKEIKEVNMLNGTKKVAQTGKNGTKKITYLVTLDRNGKEISRQKIKEEVVLEPVEEIVKIGTSDFNLNTDTYEIAFGFVCSEDQLIEDSGYIFCDDSIPSMGSFFSIKIKNQDYATCIGDNSCTHDLAVNLSSPLPLSYYTEYLKTAVYNGQALFFDARAGDYAVPLTEEICNRFHLSCGRW